MAKNKRNVPSKRTARTANVRKRLSVWAGVALAASSALGWAAKEALKPAMPLVVNPLIQRVSGSDKTLRVSSVAERMSDRKLRFEVTVTAQVADMPW